MDFSILYLFAEITIGIAGFIAIVISFKTSQTKWRQGDLNIFFGMLTHCSEALLFSMLLPILSEIFQSSQDSVLMIMSFALGLVTAFHMSTILIVEWKRGWMARFIAFITASIGYFVLYNLYFKVYDFYAVYILGAFVHVFQAFFLFVFTMVEDVIIFNRSIHNQD